MPNRPAPASASTRDVRGKVEEFIDVGQMLRCDLPLRSDTGALAIEGRLPETRMPKTSRPFYYQNHKRSREHKAPAPTTDSLDLSNYCPSDLIPQADLSMSARNKRAML